LVGLVSRILVGAGKRIQKVEGECPPLRFCPPSSQEGAKGMVISLNKELVLQKSAKTELKQILWGS